MLQINGKAHPCSVLQPMGTHQQCQHSLQLMQQSMLLMLMAGYHYIKLQSKGIAQ
jgi:hypothetical protein